MADTLTDGEIAAMRFDHMLEMVAKVRAKKPRDPLRAVEDELLDMRAEALE